MRQGEGCLGILHYCYREAQGPVIILLEKKKL